MIIERVTHDSYGDQLRRRIAGPLGLRNLFYSATRLPRKVLDRLPAGYFYDHSVPAMAPLLGRDQSRRSSYTQGAGGIVISLQDMARWDRALYTGGELPPKQQHELESLVSENPPTGKPISQTTPTDPVGFGLGIEQHFSPLLGEFWSYSGETLGFTVIHFYLPRSGTIITLGLNSAPESTPATATAFNSLFVSIYKTLHRARLG